jgi:hypothetical protein
VLKGDRLAFLRAFTVLLAAAFLLASLAAACGDDDLQGLDVLADNATEGATANVTYRVTTSIDDEMTESEQIVVQRPPASRLEISVPGDEPWSRSVVIKDSDKLYVCLGNESEGTCLDLQPADGSRDQALAQAGLHVPVEHPLTVELFDTPRLLVESTEDIGSLDKSQRQVAGLDATCFAEEVEDLKTELCFSDEGLTLYWRWTQVSPDGVTRVFEATAVSISSDVTDEDFVPPYEITEGSLLETPAP